MRVLHLKTCRELKIFRIFKIAVCVALCIVLILADPLYACTAVVFHGKSLVVARNMDWDQPDALIVRNERGVKKEASFLQDNDDDDFTPLKWVSKYASITFNVTETALLYGNVSIPVDGLNEKGLWVSSLWLDDNSGMPQNLKESVLSINNWELVKYLLDTCSSVQEAVDEINKLQIVTFNFGTFSVNLHYMMADNTGNVAIVDVYPDGPVIVQNPPVNVLTNNYYKNSLDNLKNYVGYGGTQILSFNVPMNSKNRFVKAALLYKRLKKNSDCPICQVFKVMSETSQNDTEDIFDEGLTQWTVGYDLNKREIYWYSRSKNDKKFIKMSDIDFSRHLNVNPLHINDVLVGNVTHYFNSTQSNAVSKDKIKVLFLEFNRV